MFMPSVTPPRSFRDLLALGGPIFVGVACARILYGAHITREAPLLVVGMLAIVGFGRRHLYIPLSLFGLAVFGVAGDITGVRRLLLEGGRANWIRLSVSIVATAIALIVVQRRRVVASSAGTARPGG